MASRLIKRYENRKLYDTANSRYVTLPDVAALIRNGDDIRVVRHKTKADLTSATLAQVLFEEELRKPTLSAAALIRIIRAGLPG